MALNKKISELPAAITAAAANIFAVVQSGVTRQISLQAIAEWILQTFAGFTANGIGAVASTIASILGGWVTPQMFGGTTNAAVAAAVATGKSVYFPDANYTISAAIAAATAGQHLYGGPLAKLVVSAGFSSEGNSNKGIIHVTADRVQVRGLTIDCSAATDASGVKILDSDECLVDGVTVLSPPSASASSGYGVWIFGESRRNVVTNCLVVSAGYSSYDCAQGSAGVPNGNRFIGNRSVTPTVNSFDIYRTQKTAIIGNVCVGGSAAATAIRLTGGTSGQPNRGCVIQGNTIDDVDADGITLTDYVQDTIVSGNHIGDAGGKGIIFSGANVTYCGAMNNTIATAGTNGIEFNTVTHCTAENNISRQNGQHGIFLSSADFNIVSGNHCYLNDQSGIQVTSSDDNNIFGNLVKDNSQETNATYNGIDVITSNTNFIHGNVARYDSTLTNDQKRGIAVNSGTSNVVINNDVRTSGASGGFADAGTTTIKRNNLGFVTENSGTGSIASGATTAVITHGLGVTPTVDDITITFAEQGTNAYGRFWVDTLTSTQFTVNVSADPGASNLDFGWRAMCL